MLPDVHRGPARRHRQPRRRRGRRRRRKSCATTATTRISSSPPTRAPRSFSDIANEIAVARGFWLGDAFASGGSTGYDHKKMGITARGAWESVNAPLPPARHRRARRPTSRSSASATCRATCSATACCCRDHIRLVAAFDHRHVFLDPDPDPAASFAERQAAVRAAPLVVGRLRPRRSSRRAAACTRAPRSRSRSRPRCATRLGHRRRRRRTLTPNELIPRLLRAPVDLLWNGGIGTFVKATTETQRRRRRQGQRRGPRRRRRPALPRRRRGRQPRLHPARPRRVRARGRPHQHRRDRQQRRRRHVRPRGEPQDPARPGRRGRASSPSAIATTLLQAMSDECRAPRAARQLPPDPRARRTRARRPPTMEDVHARFIRALEQSGDLDRDGRSAPDRRGARRPARGRARPHHARARGAARLRQDRARRKTSSPPRFPDDPDFAPGAAEYFPPACASATSPRSTSTRCAARSS